MAARPTSPVPLSSHMRAVRIHKVGGPEALTLDSLEIPTPGPGQLLVKVGVAGVNYIDTYMRTGLYKSALPITLGREGAGIVMSVGPAAPASDSYAAFAPADVKVGSRVAFFSDNTYADYAVVPAWKVTALAANIPLAIGAAAYLQGLTAHFLTHSTYNIKAGDNVLIHAGAGGCGQLLVQIAKMKGARVITTVGSKDKEAIVKALGADDIVNYSEKDFQVEVMRLTDNKGVHVVYDGVGASTWQRSLRSLAVLGHLVLFGNASGRVPPIDPLDLSGQGSITLTRPTLQHYIATPQALQARARDLFGWIANNQLRVTVARTFPLAEAADAHRFLEGRGSAGKILLTCDPGLV